MSIIINPLAHKIAWLSHIHAFKATHHKLNIPLTGFVMLFYSKYTSIQGLI